MQVRRWSQQYKLSVVHTGGPHREVLGLSDWLSDNIPVGDDSRAFTRLSHGDYRSTLLITLSLNHQSICSGTTLTQRQITGDAEMTSHIQCFADGGLAVSQLSLGFLVL